MKILSLALLALSVLPAAADWPRYFGTSFDGKADDTAIRDSWLNNEPAVKWTVETGKGFGGAAIADGKVYFLDRDLGAADVMRCLDLETGKEIWKTRYDAPGKLPFAGSRSVPTLSESSIFTSGGFGQASCFSRDDGKLLWQHDFVKDFGGEIPRFGYSTNPVLWGDLVIYAVLGEKTGLAAFDQKTGEQKWQTPGVFLTTSSPIIYDLAGKEQLLFLSSENSGTLERLVSSSAAVSIPPPESFFGDTTATF